MSYEVDVRAVGEESKSGDAIALRYGDFSDRSRYRVMIIDGGFEADGRDLVDVVQGLYGTNSVDVVVSSHPDDDHSSGLKVVLEELRVSALWLHRPWRHGVGVSAAMEEDYKKSVETARELEELASRRGAQIIDPFAGLQS